MSDFNGNGNPNGNGHEKAFVLGRPKTPEEIAQETTRKIAPEIRRSVRGLKICAAAKFLFDALLDDTFMFDFGGDGRGLLVASVRDLAVRYGHNKDSISKWAEILRRECVIWWNDVWPFREWHVSAISPPPESKASAVQKIRARASAKRHQNLTEPAGQSAVQASRSSSAAISEETGHSDRKPPVTLTEGIGGTDRHLRTDCPAGSVTNRGHLRSHRPTPSDTLTDTSRRVPPIGSVKGSESDRSHNPPSSMVSVARLALEKSPDVRSGALESNLNVQRGMNALKRKSGENGFLLEVATVMARFSPKYAKTEMEGSGGWWRTKFRESPDKAWRVIGEIKSMILEKKIRKNPGSAAVDLWSRLP